MEYHNDRRKGSGILLAAKLESSFEEPCLDRSAAICDRAGDVLMPPDRIGSNRQQADDGRAVFLGALLCLGYPSPHGAAVGRIHPADVFPLLLEPVLFLSEEASALGVLGKRRDIERKAKLLVQFIEQVLRRPPLVRAAAEVNRLILSCTVRPLLFGGAFEFLFSWHVRGRLSVSKRHRRAPSMVSELGR